MSVTFFLLKVNNNGVVSFNEPVFTFDAEPFPITSSPMLTPYWGDVDTSGTGMVWYLQTNNSELLTMARNDVLAVYTDFDFFNPTTLLIATWDHVGYFNLSVNLVSIFIFVVIIYLNNVSLFVSTQTNTFQCILATDGIYSFAIFLYADNLIQWSLGDESEAHAQAGFNAGDGVRHLTIGGSQTPAIVDIETTSNIGVPGKYLFRVDDTTIVATPPGME